MPLLPPETNTRLGNDILNRSLHGQTVYYYTAGANLNHSL